MTKYEIKVDRIINMDKENKIIKVNLFDNTNKLKSHIGCIILFVCLFCTVLHKKGLTVIVFEEGDIHMKNCKINLSEILYYYLFKFSLQNFAGLRIKTKKYFNHSL